MTECCLLHCFRPATFQRLLDDAMSPKEIAANSRQKKIDRLTAYAAAYPKKIELLRKKIDHLIAQNLHSKNKQSRHMILIGLRIYMGLVSQLHAERLSHLLTASLLKAIPLLLCSQDAEYIDAAADLLAICLHTDPTANYSAYIPSALTVCYSNKDRSEDPVNLIGMKLLLRLMQNLLLHPADLDEHLAALVEVCFFHLLSQINVDSGAMSSGLKMEALQEAAEECQHIFRDVLSPAGAEAETVVDHSWRCVHALARFPSASILKQVVSVALDVFDRFQRTYQRNCANSADCPLSRLLLQVLFVIDRTAKQANLLGLPIAMYCAAHFRNNVVDSTRILSSQSSLSGNSYGDGFGGRSAETVGTVHRHRLGRRPTEQMGSELILRSQPALVEYVLESVGFLLFWVKMEACFEDKQRDQHIQFCDDLTYRSTFTELVQLLFSILAFVLRISSNSGSQTMDSGASNAAALSNDSHALLLAAQGAMHIFSQESKSMSTQPNTLFHSAYHTAVIDLDQALEESNDTLQLNPNPGADIRIASTICRIFELVELIAQRHVALNIYFSETLLSIFLDLGNIESEQLFPAHSEVVHSYRLCVFTALHIVLFNSTKNDVKARDGRDLFAHEYLPLSIKFLFNTSVPDLYVLVKESVSWKIFQLHLCGLLSVVHNLSATEPDEWIPSQLSADENSSDHLDLLGGVGRPAEIRSGNLFVNKWFPFSSSQINVLHDFIFDTLTSEIKVCPGSCESHSLYFCALWNFEMSLLDRFGLDELLRLMPLLLALLDNWSAVKYKLVCTVTSNKSTKFASNESAIECIACQRLFFVMALLYASDRILVFPELRKAALQFFEDWALDFTGGLTVVEANLTEFTVSLVQSEITRRKFESRENAAPPRAVQPAEVPTEEQTELTGASTAEGSSRSPLSIVADTASFDSTNSRLYFDSEAKPLPQSQEGGDLAELNAEEEVDVEEEEEEESPPPPQPLQHPHQIGPDSAAAVVRKQLLSLFLRAPKLKHIPPNKLKQMFEDGFRLHHDIEEDREDRQPRLKRELFPDSAGERKTHFADEEGEVEAEQQEGDGAGGEIEIEDDGAEQQDSSDSDAPSRAEKASKVPFSPMPLQGILKKSSSGEQQSTAKRVNYSSLPQMQKQPSQIERKGGLLRNRRGVGTGSGFGPAAVWKEKFQSVLAEKNKVSEEEGLQSLLAGLTAM